VFCPGFFSSTTVLADLPPGAGFGVSVVAMIAPYRVAPTTGLSPCSLANSPASSSCTRFDL
jgi:pantoate kinase